MDQASTAYLSLQGLSLKTPFGRVYEDVNLSVEKGQVCALFGSEGSGKSSLLLSIAGRMKFQQGQGSVGGYDLKKQYKKIRGISAVTIIERINDVPEFLSVRDLIAAELQMNGKKANKAAVTAYLKKWNFMDFERDSYRSLEAEDRLRFGIMLACVSDPELLLVDDIQHGVIQHRSLMMVEQFKQMARETGMTVMYATNEYEIAVAADCVVVISQKAEEQRRAVLADKGPSFLIPIAGTGNGVVLSS